MKGSYEFTVQGAYKQIFIKSSVLGCTTKLLFTSNISLQFRLHVSAHVLSHIQVKHKTLLWAVFKGQDQNLFTTA
jgi:hypothetical protein